MTSAEGAGGDEVEEGDVADEAGHVGPGLGRRFGLDEGEERGPFIEPRVLGDDRVDEVGWHLIEAEAQDVGDRAERAQLLVAQLTEAALLIARADDPAATRAVLTELLDEQLDALRTAPR